MGIVLRVNFTRISIILISQFVNSYTGMETCAAGGWICGTAFHSRRFGSAQSPPGTICVGVGTGALHLSGCDAPGSTQVWKPATWGWICRTAFHSRRFSLVMDQSGDRVGIPTPSGKIYNMETSIHDMITNM